jgi:hypothetical protein
MSFVKVALRCKLLASLVLRMGSEEMEITGPCTANTLVTVIGAMARRLSTILPTFLIGQCDLHLHVKRYSLYMLVAVNYSPTWISGGEGF